MDAIFTKYHGPGNVRGSRISARCGGKKVVHMVDNAFSIFDNHAHAMRKLVEVMGVSGKFARADGPGGAQVWVKVDVDTLDGVP